MTTEILPTEEQEANTCLMAAARELLEFAERIGAAIEKGDPQEIADIWLGAGRAAIAKATGG